MFWILVGIALPVFLYLILIRPFKVWSSRGMPQHDLKFLWIQTFKDVVQLRPAVDSWKELHDSFPNDRYAGFYQFFQPAIMLRDPNLIKQITVKDADHFVDHVAFVPIDSEPLWDKNLFALTGDKWREMRATLSPSFTSSKMKSMFGLIRDCADKFVHYFENQGSSTTTVEMKDIFSRFTNDVIASAAFGVTCDSLENKDNEFYKMGKVATNFEGFRFIILFGAPKLAKWLGITFFHEKVRPFFKKVITDNIKIREREGIVRPDMIHLLMEARKGKTKPESRTEAVINECVAVTEETFTQTQAKPAAALTDDDITSQAFIFFIAGFDTVSSTMAFTAHELAVNPDVQERLQCEIDDTLNDCGGTITYEALMTMKYMDMVISESLRKWPSAAATDRLCVKPYTIEPERPGEKSFHIQKGDAVVILTYGIHRDPAHFPEPERFDPERFSEENKSKINPYAYMPFGTGPRACIGNRFALMEIKTLFFYILSKFSFVVIDKTDVPLKLANSAVTLTAKGGFWLGLQPRKI